MKYGIWLEQLAQDARLGLRGLLRTPGFTLVAVGSLALGIGANLVLYGLLTNVLLEQPTAARPDRLYRVVVRGGVTSFPNYRDFTNEGVFDSITAYTIRPLHYQRRDATTSIFAIIADGNFFETLKVQAAR